MSEEFLAPLSRDKLTELAVEAYGYVPDSKTVKTAVELGLRILQEAERLAEPWKLRQLCRLEGHQFNFGSEHFPAVMGAEAFSIARWQVKPTKCVRCDGVLEVTYKELI